MNKREAKRRKRNKEIHSLGIKLSSAMVVLENAELELYNLKFDDYAEEVRTLQETLIDIDVRLYDETDNHKIID